MPREHVLEAALAWAKALKTQHAEIVRIGYFGSYAKDTYTPSSDFDVLIEVQSAGASRQADRSAPFRPDRFPVGMELFVYTTEELIRLRRGGSSFLISVEASIHWLVQAGTE